MKKILIIGHQGNMGKRYTAVCKRLGIKVVGQDFNDPRPPMSGVDGIIIASPTSSHTRDILNYSGYDLPYLCEKPLSKLPIELDNFIDVTKKLGVRLKMINQYDELIDHTLNGDSHYNYYRTGNDGIAWDCINILGLAKGTVTLSSDSPIWDCQINGQKLSIADMDGAYISMIEKWAEYPDQNLDYIRTSHLKVFRYLREVNKRVIHEQ